MASRSEMVRKNKSNKKFISFSGPSCSGKTTIIDAVNWDDYFDDYKLINSHTRTLKASGVKINDNGNDQTQVKVMDGHLGNYSCYAAKSNTSTYITDRCVLDGMSYSEWLVNTDRVHRNILKYAGSIFMDVKDKIDILFYCEPVKYRDDADRKMSKRDHEIVCGLFESYLGMFEIGQVVRLKGSVKDRLKIIDNKLKYGINPKLTKEEILKNS